MQARVAAARAHLFVTLSLRSTRRDLPQHISLIMLHALSNLWAAQPAAAITSFLSSETEITFLEVHAAMYMWKVLHFFTAVNVICTSCVSAMRYTFSRWWA